MHHRIAAALAIATLALTALAGCSGATPKPTPTSPSTACFPGVPKVPGTMKAGSDVTVVGPGSGGCSVRFTTKDRTVSIVLVDTKDQLLASTTVKASAQGAYKAQLHVPSTFAGVARVRLDSGFRFECDDNGSCAAPMAQVKVTSTRS